LGASEKHNENANMTGLKDLHVVIIIIIIIIIIMKIIIKILIPTKKITFTPNSNIL